MPEWKHPEDVVVLVSKDNDSATVIERRNVLGETRLSGPEPPLSRMLRKPVFCERIGAVAEITGGSAAKSGRVGGLTASVWRRPRRFRGARSGLRPGVRPV
jgi:hypothetical protein